VIQFLPSQGSMFSKHALESPHLAALHFTGSTPVFKQLWKHIGNNLNVYKTYPRIVGETGGKNFHFLHNSVTNVTSFVMNTIRGAFEYSGQKCSATSRVYVPKSLWPQVKDMMVSEIKKLKVGQSDDPTSFFSSVIDESAFNDITGFIDRAKKNSDCNFLTGGNYDKKVGYFIEPTLIVCRDPHSETMEKEIFGPVLSLFVYEDEKLDETLDILDRTSEYALTGSIFAKNREAINYISKKLENACGNLYLNDKSTGAVVGQQPFGGARASGTNDKAGSENILTRWVSMRSIKENFNEIKHWKYPSVDYEPEKENFSFRNRS